MKTRIAAFVIAAIVAVNLSYSQTPASQRGEPQKKFATLEQKVELTKKNLIMGLNSDNTGLIESCIKLAAKIKLYLPSTDIAKVQEVLDELSITHRSPTVRYKAYIASNICSDPEWYAQENSVITADEDQFFINAAHRLQQKLFGLNSF